MPWEAPWSIQTGTSGLSIERDRSECFMPASGIDVAPAYLEKQSKSEAVSKTGGGTLDNSMHRNEPCAQ